MVEEGNILRDIKRRGIVREGDCPGEICPGEMFGSSTTYLTLCSTIPVNVYDLSSMRSHGLQSS